MTRNIVFVSIFDFTHLFYEIASDLEKRGHRVFWITTSRTWTNWLLYRGVAAGRIKQLIYAQNEQLSVEERRRLTVELAACEAQGDLTANQCLMMDRFVTRRSDLNQNDLVLKYYRDVKSFLVEQKIALVFGEPTNLNELITCMVCRELGVPFIAPWDMRYPLGRVVFTKGYLQDRPVGKGEGDAVVSGDQLLTDFRKDRIKPAYFDRLNKTPVTTAAKLWRSFGNRWRRGEFTRQAGLTHHSVWSRAELILRRIVNSFYLRHLVRYDRLDEIDNKIVFYGLHVQPEASIDVRGSYFNDQIKLLKDIRRALPFDYTLVVKEHPNFLGIRGRGYMNAIRSIPNTRLVRYDVPTSTILKRASIVVTVSGTIAYEAGMLGVPAVCFSPVYFDVLSSVYCCADVTRLRDLVRQIENQRSRDYDKDCAAIEELVRRSYPGRWIDPYNDASVLQEDNLSALREAFAQIAEDDSL